MDIQELTVAFGEVDVASTRVGQAIPAVVARINSQIDAIAAAGTPAQRLALADKAKATTAALNGYADVLIPLAHDPADPVPVPVPEPPVA